MSNAVAAERLGVDLGTTWTAAAVFDGRAVQPVSLGAAGAAMPSVVAIVDGTPVAGDAAVRAGQNAPASAAREFKRRLGDTTPLLIGGTPYGAETLTGHLLAHVVRTAGGARTVTLTHPATWGEFKLDLLREAGRVAGLADVELLPEPVAAARHYAHQGRLTTGDTVAVYDFGGGTFDVAVVRLDPTGPQLLGRAEGLDRLGGLDLDQAVLAHVNGALDGALTAMDRDDPDVRRAALALRADCIVAKEALSADTDTTVSVRFPGLSTEVRITRPEFEAAVRPRVAETLTAFDRALASAGVAVGDLAGVVMVGGSSRIPLVAEQVTSHTGRPLLVDADPKLSVASGAAEPTDIPAPPSAPAAAGATGVAAGAVVATAATVAATAATVTAVPSPPAPAQAASHPDAPTEPTMPDNKKPSVPPPPPGAKGAGSPPAPGAGSPPAPPRSGAGQAERRTSAAAGKKEESGLSSIGKVAAGVAAAGAATAAGLLWHEDVTNALGITDDAPDDTLADAAADVAAAVPAEESLDAFEAAAAPAGGSGGGGGGGGSGGGGGGGRAFAPPRPRQQRPDADDGDNGASGPFAPPQAGSAAPLPAGFADAQDELRQRLENWQPPEGADPAEAAELRDRLEAMVNRFQPRPGQSTEDAIAELRDEFDVRIDNFVQDVKLDVIAEAQDDLTSVDPEFEAQREVLIQRLANWTPPPGTDPARAEQMRAELAETLRNFTPIPGQTADQAIQALQDEFDDEVRLLENEDKVEVIADEVGAQTPPVDPVTGEPVPVDPATGQPMPTDDTTDPATGDEATPAEDETPATEDETPATEDETPATEGETPATGEETPASGEMPDDVEPPSAGEETPPTEETPDVEGPAGEEPADTTSTPDPRVTMPLETADAATAGLVDDFDALVDEADGMVADAVGDVAGDADVPVAEASLDDDVLGDHAVADAIGGEMSTEVEPSDPFADDLGLDTPAFDDTSFDDITFDAEVEPFDAGDDQMAAPTMDFDDPSDDFGSDDDGSAPDADDDPGMPGDDLGLD